MQFGIIFQPVDYPFLQDVIVRLFLRIFDKFFTGLLNVTTSFKTSNFVLKPV